jgi:uncharacterized protein with NAD-binding domain and iron-sulfur cluster
VTPAEATAKPKKVVVLGGGAAGVTAAYELTATPKLHAAHDVTLYTLGWRLGGKGASGRNAACGQRIEEHGLHIWFGFYDNAFGVMRRCYEELKRPDGAALSKWSDAFKPRSDCVQYERFGDRWVPHHFTLPTNSLTPGDPGTVGPWEMLRQTVAFIESDWLGSAPSAPSGSRGRAGHAGARHGLRLLHRRARHHAQRGHRAPWELRPAAWLMRRIRNWTWRYVVRERVENDRLRLFFMWLDLATAMLTGIARDRVLKRGFGAINDEEFRAWLSRHGAMALTVQNAPMVRAIYDAAFCYEEGDISRPNVAAGKAAQDLIRSLLCYKGALMYKMQAGMGDAVFAPFYEVLTRRPPRAPEHAVLDEELERPRVDFKFFHCVTRLSTSPDGKSIDEIELIRQATLAGERYDPLVEVKELPCWPSEPQWEQLKEGERLKAMKADLEQDPNPLGRDDRIILRRGVDFDAVVLAIPVGALEPICEELVAANRDFACMLASSHTVMTQAVQLWLSRDANQLGFPYAAGSLASCFVEPLDTYCDMDQLLEREDWPAGSVGQIAYFCGVLPHAGIDTQAQADAKTYGGALEFLRRDVQTIWPRSQAEDGFDWGLLVDGNGADGPRRLQSQYWRANFGGSERYALTLAGTVKNRLWPSKSGFDNLVLAGDWTRNGIDGGSVEAAVTSGMLAARAVCGSPTVVHGTRGALESDRGEHHRSRRTR